ncbi:hypothetical protein CY34DRAFT_27291 [Suillus luteus UH-Slu-Lm8-n1]|uniref:Uncharacterized protein n=1 Tax=Suillus luteus UH-Slu-Lm8-n1 TaxID=930992 RepID=A0A0D0AIY4_9AGAM|nr:hypothetical protein CY34DRAFT_27291 [Suillus luteus UH-Slu-Lm8-n1]
MQPTLIVESTSTLRAPDAPIHIAYVEQQRIDRYEEMVRHAIKRKTAFDKRVLKKAPGEVIFNRGQLVQLLPKWSVPRRIKSRLQNSYKLETLEGTILQGEYSARRLRAFMPREGTELAMKQEVYERKLAQQSIEEKEDEEPKNIVSIESQDIEDEDNEEEDEDREEEEGEA